MAGFEPDNGTATPTIMWLYLDGVGIEKLRLAIMKQVRQGHHFMAYLQLAPNSVTSQVDVVPIGGDRFALTVSERNAMAGARSATHTFANDVDPLTFILHFGACVARHHERLHRR